MTRPEAIEQWLHSLGDLELCTLQECSRQNTISGIASWIVESEWLPDSYDPAFPYPEIILVDDDPNPINDEPSDWNWDDPSGAWFHYS